MFDLLFNADKNIWYNPACRSLRQRGGRRCARGPVDRPDCRGIVGPRPRPGHQGSVAPG